MCKCQTALARAVAKRDRLRAQLERQHAQMEATSPELAAYWRGSATAQLVEKPVRVALPGGCLCGRSEATAP